MPVSLYICHKENGGIVGLKQKLKKTKELLFTNNLALFNSDRLKIDVFCQDTSKNTLHIEIPP